MVRLLMAVSRRADVAKLRGFVGQRRAREGWRVDHEEVRMNVPDGEILIYRQCRSNFIAKAGLQRGLGIGPLVEAAGRE